MSYVLDLHDADRTHVALAGGKGAHLGELMRIDGVRVPPGFCITTTAFQRFLEHAGPGDDGASAHHIRETIERTPIPEDIAGAIRNALARLGDRSACAVRSSATAEDSLTASFAGQHDSYLNVIGPDAILQHVRLCWASLFTERAVNYRARNGIDSSKAQMAVVVQRMVIPHCSGVLFTADPVTGNRRISSVEAVVGFGEALVSGLVNADVYKVRDREVIASEQRQDRVVLTETQLVQLADLGRRIEAHFGAPQDIEWCLADDGFHIVQSRPITTLFPIPYADDGANHVYLSVGHQQMMTDAMKPLGISFWQLTSPAPMREAGGRLFVDVTPRLASPAMRAALLELAGKSDPLMRDALQTVIDRDFIATRPDADAPVMPNTGGAATALEADARIVDELIARSEASIAALRQNIRGRTGTGLLEFILADLAELKRILFDAQSHQVIMAGMEATWWLNERLEAWLGEKNAADTLAQSVANNVTSEMGLALLSVADVVRRYPNIVAYLEQATDDDVLDELPEFRGGTEVREAIIGWLAKYGMRCAGEIDITRPRWSERPTTLLPLLLGNVRNFEPGAGERRFEQGLMEARRKEHELLERVRALPDGEQKAAEAKQMIDRLRTFIGYREYPKYGMVSRYFIYKQALLEEAERLVQARVLREKEDMFFLTFHELQDVVRTMQSRDRLIRERRDAFRLHQSLTPPRVLTSDGEMLNGAYRRDGLPAGALVGLPVSAGTVEGRARIILDMAEANLEPGDILVTTFTDPSWTPLFVAIAALVTEVGGLMTHGAVIAREYGVPAVVGVEHATRMIRDGQRIRVHGTEGYVEILD